MSTTTHTTTQNQARPDSILSGRRGDDRGPRSRPRRTGLLALASLLIVGSALAGAVLFARAGDTVEVLAVGDRITEGHEITRADLVVKNVAGIDGTFGVNETAAAIGKIAVVDLLPGQVLTRSMLTDSPVPAAGMAVVGLSLDNARVPASGLTAGDIVNVIAVPAAAKAATAAELDTPPLLAEDATIYDVKGEATQGGRLMLTLIVDESAAGRIAAYSTAGRVAVVETSAATQGAS